MKHHPHYQHQSSRTSNIDLGNKPNVPETPHILPTPKFKNFQHWPSKHNEAHKQDTLSIYTCAHNLIVDHRWHEKLKLSTLLFVVCRNVHCNDGELVLS